MLSICLVETERTVKEVWSKAKKLCKSVKDTFLISAKSIKNLFNFGSDFRVGVMFPLKNIIRWQGVKKDGKKLIYKHALW